MARAKPTVTYKKKDQVAWISMNRPEFNNAQNGKMTYDLDKFFKRAVDDDDVKVIVLKGNDEIFAVSSISSMASSLLDVAKAKNPKQPALVDAATS